MEQLSGLDSAFVHQDSARTPMHVTAVLVYDVGAQEKGAIQRRSLRRLVTSRLWQFPVFRRKLRRVALDVDTPYWVEVPRPDFDYHISVRSLGKPSDWSGLEQVLTEIHRQSMDLSRPLWEMCLVRGLRDLPGLPPQCQALVLKVHHSAIDGMSLAVIIDAMHRRAKAQPHEKVGDQREPDTWDVWTRFNLNNIGRQLKFAKTVRGLVPGVLRARKARSNFTEMAAVSGSRARFNDRIGGGRTMGAAIWPREEFIAIRRAVRHVTLNDIALSVVSGALREYLTHYGQLPARSLVAGVPVNLRGPAADSAEGNRIATMMVGLATAEDDPVERLRQIHRYAVAAKKRIDALGTGTVMDISDSVSPNILAGGIKAMAQASVMALAPVPFHTMVSNVPGPMTPLRLGSADLVVPFGFGPVRDNMGLFHIVSNGQGRMSLSFSACDRLMPDGEFYRDCLQRAYLALSDQAALLPRSTRPGK
jgi:diacylglycerol O-acyltransferase